MSEELADVFGIRATVLSDWFPRPSTVEGSVLNQAVQKNTLCKCAQHCWKNIYGSWSSPVPVCTPLHPKLLMSFSDWNVKGERLHFQTHRAQLLSWVWTTSEWFDVETNVFKRADTLIRLNSVTWLTCRCHIFTVTKAGRYINVTSSFELIVRVRVMWMMQASLHDVKSLIN